MKSHYYIKKELVIEYQAKNGRICTIYTNTKFQKGFIFSYPDEDSDDDFIIAHRKFKAELERKIKENTYDKILFKNGKWIEESYKKEYENTINESCADILRLLKVYKKMTAWEIM